MAELVVVRSLVPYALRLEDIGVHLAGRGSTAAVLKATADSSSDLARERRAGHVSVSAIPGASLSPVRPKMPTWPFMRPPPPPPLPPPPESGAVLEVLGRIDGKLGELLRRPVAPPPEVVAAHLKAVSAVPGIPAGLPGGGPLPGPAGELQFIPSTILPESADVDIRVRKESVSADVDSASDALREMRRKK